jgi:hypothetical protein
LYLYNALTPPAPGTLTSQKVVQALKTAARDKVVMDMDWVMKNGGGRFMNLARFQFIGYFLIGRRPKFISEKAKDALIGSLPVVGLFTSFSNTIPDGLKPKVYTLREIQAEYKLNKDDIAKTIRQYEYDKRNENEFINRCLVFGTSSFRVNADAEFEVFADGRREIRNVCVRMLDDNFDFTSNSFQALIDNMATESRVDPWGLGKTVEIEFRGPVTTVQNGFLNGKYSSLKGDGNGRSKDWNTLVEKLKLIDSLKFGLGEAAMNYGRLSKKRMEILEKGGVLYSRRVISKSSPGKHGRQTTVKTFARDEL